MSNKNLHPSVQEFKAFVKEHPGLIKEVKHKNQTWQDFYEKWVLLGEEDAMWDKYKHVTNGKDSTETNKEKTEKQELISQFMNMVENVDLDKVQGHIHQLNGAITNIQSLVGQFQEAKKQFSTQQGKTPFHMNKD